MTVSRGRLSGLPPLLQAPTAMKIRPAYGVSSQAMRRLLVMSCLAHSDRLLMIAGKRIRVAEDAKALRERVRDLNLDEMDVDQLNAILAAAGQADD